MAEIGSTEIGLRRNVKAAGMVIPGTQFTRRRRSDSYGSAHMTMHPVSKLRSSLWCSHRLSISTGSC